MIDSRVNTTPQRPKFIVNPNSSMGRKAISTASLPTKTFTPIS